MVLDGGWRGSWQVHRWGERREKGRAKRRRILRDRDRGGQGHVKRGT